MCVALPPPPLVRGVNQGWWREGRRWSRQCDSGCPISEAEHSPRLPRTTAMCLFRWFSLSTETSIASRHPGAGSGGAGSLAGPGAQTLPLPHRWLWHTTVWQEPCAGLRLSWFDANSLALAVSTCFYEMHHAGWWLRVLQPRPSGGEDGWSPAGHRRRQDIPVPASTAMTQNARWRRASKRAGLDNSATWGLGLCSDRAPPHPWVLISWVSSKSRQRFEVLQQGRA